jgi:uncharacterized RmlC-like cupin family protein/transcriptional regulator with XRE-family HTH domain
MREDLDHQSKRVASNLRSILNDLKRRPKDAAADLGVSEDEMFQYLGGERALPMELVSKASKVWPVSPRDFFLLKDDCPDGVRIMRAEDSRRSGRRMTRASKEYYEYRDTAASSVGSFRPEWIQELCVVDDNDPNNPEVQWNNGHFLHQFTYFVGPVNFYYRAVDGSKQVAVMNTGDSMYITPFVPHTFTTRKNAQGELGHILALTYSNKLGGEAQQELSLLGAEQAKHLVLDFSSRLKAIGSLIRFHREGASLTQECLEQQLGFAQGSFAKIESGTSELAEARLPQIAEALRVGVRDLLACEQAEDPVQCQTYAQSRKWKYPNSTSPAYGMVELCGTRKLSFSKALELTILRSAAVSTHDLQTGLHQYVYNLGEKPVNFGWTYEGQAHQETLQPGDSMYVKPGVPHAFSGEGAKLLVLRIGGRVGGDTLNELSYIGDLQLNRVLNENMQWFDPKGRQDVKKP